jgi:hypothetical protein
MHMHTLEFENFLNKRIAVDYLKQEELYDDLDECLTEKKLTFFTGIALRKHQTARLLKEVPLSNYCVSEL